MKRIDVSQLRPGMLTPDWEVIGEPYEADAPTDTNQPAHGIAVDMRHRIDRGASTIWYEVGAQVTVLDGSATPGAK